MPFSWHVLLVLLVVLALAAAMFAVLVHRWTSGREQFALSDWGKSRGFALADPKNAQSLPGNLKNMPSVIGALVSNKTAMLCLQGEQDRWHALVRKIDSNWQPTALRPAEATTSLLDLYSLSSYPTLGNTERFVVFGTDSAAARALSATAARGLLPPDIGLLLVGPHLVLDFTERPFDPIEFDRMNALAEQLVAHLPTAI